MCGASKRDTPQSSPSIHSALYLRAAEEAEPCEEAASTRRGAERGGSALGEEVEDRLDGHHSIAAEGGARPSLARTARGQRRGIAHAHPHAGARPLALEDSATAARHGRRYYETGERMPVAVFLGGDPVYPFCATAPMPDGLDEFLLAGYLRRKSVEMVQCETCDLEVPANADIVIEGYIDPTEPLRDEGPFGDHTGYYTLPEPYPVFHITAITHRKNATFPATIVGIPPMEDFYMGSASVKLFLPIFRMNFPEITDIALPAEGVFHNLVFVSIKKTYPMQAFKIMHGLWGMGQMMFTKYIVVVDDFVDVHNTSEVLFHMCADTDPQRDSILTKGPADVLDHATSEIAIGGKLGIDATRKLPGEGHHRNWPPLIQMDEATKAKIDGFLKNNR